MTHYYYLVFIRFNIIFNEDLTANGNQYVTSSLLTISFQGHTGYMGDLRLIGKFINGHCYANFYRNPFRWLAIDESEPLLYDRNKIFIT